MRAFLTPRATTPSKQTWEELEEAEMNDSGLDQEGISDAVPVRRDAHGGPSERARRCVSLAWRLPPEMHVLDLACGIAAPSRPREDRQTQQG